MSRMLHDFSFKTPEELLAGLQGSGGHGGMGASSHGMHGPMGGMRRSMMGGMDHGGGMHANDIDYDA